MKQLEQGRLRVSKSIAAKIESDDSNARDPDSMMSNSTLYLCCGDYFPCTPQMHSTKHTDSSKVAFEEIITVKNHLTVKNCDPQKFPANKFAEDFMVIPYEYLGTNDSRFNTIRMEFC